MNKRNFLNSALILCVIALSAPVCHGKSAVLRDITGVGKENNARLAAFLTGMEGEKGRKVAVFDGDGTVLGQTPHYLADECLYAYAKEHPERKPELIKEMRGQSNVSMPYVQNRVHYFAGESLKSVRGLGQKCFEERYSKKIFEPMRLLIELLKENGFEIWIVTASPEALYQRFLSEALRIPITNIIGVRSVIRHGLITDEIVPPVPQDKGKTEAIETFIQETPLLAAGNSRGDREMIESSRGLRLIVNPDEHIETGEKESIADYAKRNGWLTVRINDVPEKDFPSVSSADYGIRLNKTWEYK